MFRSTFHYRSEKTSTLDTDSSHFSAPLSRRIAKRSSPNQSAIYLHINKGYLSPTVKRSERCINLISWKHSFRRLNEEYDVARKKRQALDNLLNAGRISQSTHGIFNKEIDDAISDIEKQQKALLEKMAAKVVELEEQVKTLEILLANFEIRHVTGEIGEEAYQRHNELLSLGLEAAKNELEEVKEAADQLATGEFPQDEESKQQPEDTEVAQPEVKFLEEPVTAGENQSAAEELGSAVETVTCTEVTSTETEEKTDQKQQT